MNGRVGVCVRACGHHHHRRRRRRRRRRRQQQQQQQHKHKRMSMANEHGEVHGEEQGCVRLERGALLGSRALEPSRVAQLRDVGASDREDGLFCELLLLNLVE
jgi:hemolysin activation/secretion protein